jgi:hypothetical protein
MVNDPQMNKESNPDSFNSFALSVADYIDAEYGDSEFEGLNEDEKQTIYSMMVAHYHYDGCVSNVANEIVHYLRVSRSYTKENINE